ncbi:DNA replication terminus site-binding protein [Musicola paradisiaca]|uniref:DNA replication terminus site-binding protein n=1 Tax=Musicola paradisiaca (strain Ech703) TaxID=579405 RepID=C6C580_MUSP7|nr:DNA replication terminus site-binding protein [Musicola paradisiaca]ACS85690.1 DNA replication terminus site-binding protein [Musicola paradisiaca Ech703]
MAAYDLIERMTTHFRLMEMALKDMQQLFLSFHYLGGCIHPLPSVDKGCEHDPVNRIAVCRHTGETARDLGLQHFRRLFIHHYSERVSSKSAIRLPGVLCFAVKPQEIQAASDLIAKINRLKSELEQIITVESGLEPEQRFDFVHTHLRGLITLSAYRQVIMLTDPASVRFGWANKNIIKNLTREELLANLEKSVQSGRAVAPYSKEQRASLIAAEINEITALPASAILKIKRPVKVQPIARVWYPDEQKQVQYPCPSPLLVLCQEGMMPIIGELEDYDADNIRHRHKPQAKPLRLIIPRLHLYVDES